MRQVDYDKQTLVEAETEVRRLVIVCLYGVNKNYIQLTKEQEKVLKSLLNKEQKAKLEQWKQTMLKSFFKQFENYKKLHRQSVMQEAENKAKSL